MRVFVAGVTRNKWNQQLQEIKETKGIHFSLSLSFISHDLYI